jgi:hypothetical protein
MVSPTLVNRDLRNAERGFLISEARKLFYKNRDTQITKKTDHLARELTGIPDEEMQPITEFLKTAVEYSPENYPQNDFDLVDGEPHVNEDVNFLLEEVFTVFSTFPFKYYLPASYKIAFLNYLFCSIEILLLSFRKCLMFAFKHHTF